MVKMFQRMNIEKKKHESLVFSKKIAKTVKESTVVLEKILVFSLLDLSSGMIRGKKSSKSPLLGGYFVGNLMGAVLGNCP